VCRLRRGYRRRRLCVLSGAAGEGRVHVLLLRRRRWQDRRRACRVGSGAGELPPVLVSRRWPFGEAGCHLLTAPPPASARPAAGVSGGEGRWCVSAGVCMAGGGSACLGGRRARDACTCLCPAAGVGKTGGGRVGWGGALVCRRRRGYRRRRLCVLGGTAGKVRVHVIRLRRRSLRDRWRARRAGEGGGVWPPALVSRRWLLGEAGRHLGTAPPPFDGKTGGGPAWRSGALVCCRRCLYGRRWPLGGTVAAGVGMAGGGTACWGWWVGKCGD